MKDIGAGGMAWPVGPLKPTVNVRSGVAIAFWPVESASPKITRLSPTRKKLVTWIGRMAAWAVPEAGAEDGVGTGVGETPETQAARTMVSTATNAATRAAASDREVM